MLRPFEVRIDAKPVKLRQLAKKLGEAGSQPPPGLDFESVLQQLADDADRMGSEELVERWYRRPREMRFLLFELCNEWPSISNDRYEQLNNVLAAVKAALFTLLYQRWYSSWLLPALKLWYQDPIDARLLDRIRQAVNESRFDTPLTVGLKQALDYFPSPVEVGHQLVLQGEGLKERWHNIALGNTSFGDDVLVEVCKNIFATGQNSAFYADLLGNYNYDNQDPEEKGLLHEADSNTFCRVFSLYCRNVGRFSEKNRYAWYAKDRLKSDKKSARWQNPNLEQQARDKLWNWIVSRNIKRFLDELVEDPDRRDFYLHLSDLVDDLRFHVERYRVNQLKKDLDFELSPLSPPTIQIRFGRLILFDSCRHGQSGVYIYPESGPVQWDAQFKRDRDYKGPLLDHPGHPFNLSEGWLNKRHVPGWQEVVESHIRRYM